MLFTFPSRYLFTIGRRGVLRLGGWSPHVQTRFHVSRPTQDHYSFLPIQGYHLLWLTFPGNSGCFYINYWPGPLSLVTTSGVSVDFLSSGYLDISVHRVCFPCRMTLRAGFPHSEIHGSKHIRSSPWLIAAYYVLHRLSTPRHPPNAL